MVSSPPSHSAERLPQDAATPWFLLVNPAAGNGKGKRMQAGVESAMQQAGLLAGSAVSNGPGHLKTLATEALQAGHRRLAMLGGDGTANEVLNGVCEQNAVPTQSVTLGMIGVGTGNDWLRTLGMAAKPEGAIAAMKAGQTGWHDVGVVHYGPALSQQRYFLNVAGAGFDGDVTRRVNAWTGLGRGTKWSYWLCILQELFRYQHTQIKLAGGGEVMEQKALTLAIGIGRYNGGGMMQLPDAVFDDGLLDATVIGTMSKAAMVRQLPNMLDGSFTRVSSVHRFRGTTFSLDSDPGIWVEADGEMVAMTPVAFSCLSRVIRVLLPAGE